MNSDSNDLGLMVSIGSVIGSVIALVSFWMRLSDRITRADAKAEDAQQDAAEAKNENEQLRDMIRELEDKIDRSGRDHGEALQAIRQHVTEHGFYMRDNFVRNDQFTTAVKDIKDYLLRVDGKLDAILVSGGTDPGGRNPGRAR